MSDKTPPTPGEKPRISPARITVWIAVAGIGLFLLISGIVGIIAKG
ncbi:hypothetical protein [Pseudolysinimonas yzui]|uniref:Uncharacterized protein n=1 Tax=Pseudolysinimonas yzui TaxID=2708254 RepID=A0A8J3GSZ5_9MICO|nr:hypothetical protein [Pseudolysinimonas yzui]GHF25176.1 hypothetical protein GCM10011600_27830 [Pseudolysinimonas yzui]